MDYLTVAMLQETFTMNSGLIKALHTNDLYRFPQKPQIYKREN